MLLLFRQHADSQALLLLFADMPLRATLDDYAAALLPRYFRFLRCPPLLLPLLMLLFHCCLLLPC